MRDLFLDYLQCKFHTELRTSISWKSIVKNTYMHSSSCVWIQDSLKNKKKSKEFINRINKEDDNIK